jgi:hypothetical protein
MSISFTRPMLSYVTASEFLMEVTSGVSPTMYV